jgi:hypothetical protein
VAGARLGALMSAAGSRLRAHGGPIADRPFVDWSSETRRRNRVHAVVVTVDIEDFEKAREALATEVIPRVKAAPGFVAGYWLQPDDDKTGMSIVVFESEAAAIEAARMVQPGTRPSQYVTVKSVDVRAVVANA